MVECLEFMVDKFIFKVRADYFYNAKGIWAFSSGNTIRIGLSDFIQQRSGDIAFANIRPEGTHLKAGDEIAEIETIKVNITLPSPVGGKITQVNPLMETNPEMINQDPYGEGWLCEIEADDWLSDRDHLLDAAAYFTRIKHEVESEGKNGE